VRVLVRQGSQRPLEDLVGDSEEVEAVLEAVLEAPQEVHREVHRAVPDPEALLPPVADPGVLHLAIPASLVVVTDPLERTDYPPSPMVPVRVPVLASWGDSA
jgi:hypothetical protein